MTTFLEESKEKLEAVLDEYFPKIEEEGEEKRLNKRGAALMLYSEAVLLLTLQRKQMREMVQKKLETWGGQNGKEALSDVLNVLDKE